MGVPLGGTDDFVRRIHSFRERLVLAAAAEPVGDAALFLRAAAQLGIPVDALGPAEAAGVPSSILQESAAHELWGRIDRASTGHHPPCAVRVTAVRWPYFYSAGVHLLAGEFATAATLVEEANSIAAATDHLAPARYHALLLAARGILATAQQTETPGGKAARLV